MCNANKKKLCTTECDTCYRRSCASDPSVSLWSSSNTLNPRNIMKGSDKIILWNCDVCGHINYEMSAYHKCSKKYGCPFCSSRRHHSENCDICFTNSFMNHPKAVFWNYELNGDIRPWHLFPCDINKYWFDCNDCGHKIFIAPVSITSQDNWCSYCAHLLLCDDNNCNTCLQNSLASHDKALKHWNYTKNKLVPRQVFKGGKEKCWFTCETCQHDFDAAPGSITTQGQWCPFCAKPPQRKCKENCDICRKKTFASSHRAIQWNYDKNGDVNPQDIFLQTNQMFWFYCDKCPHSFQKKISLIHTENSWCQYCSHDLLCEDDCCEMCFNNSFASHPRSNEWNKQKNGDIKPRNIMKSSNKEFWFDCNRCKKPFRTSVDKISCANQGCPKCKNKTENIVYIYLETQYPTIQHTFAVEWCKNKRNLPFDLVIENLKIIIEIDGPQHIDKQIHNWSTPKENQLNDKFKMKCANDNGYTVIRILQEDVFKNTYDWKTELLNVIKEYPEPTTIFLCKNDEYKNHIN